MKKKFNYENKEYLNKLNALSQDYYSKYILFIKKYTKNKKAFILDVGCGSGTVLSQLKKEGYKNSHGVDISKLFVRTAKKRGLKNIYSYDGSTLLFKNNYFDLVGSFNVLEHTQNPEAFLLEQLSKIKKGGYLIVACPNFLSVVLQSPHPRINGLKSKIANLLRIFQRLYSPFEVFERMEPIIRKAFQYDDDAIVVTNLIDLGKFLKHKKCEVVYESGFINYNSIIHRIINIIPLVRYILPSCFLVARKL